MAQDGIWKNLCFGCAAEGICLLLYGMLGAGWGMRLPEQIRHSSKSGILLLLPFFYMGGGCLRMYAERPVPFVSYLETERAGSGVQGIAYGVIFAVEPDGETLRLWMKDSFVVAQEKGTRKSVPSQAYQEAASLAETTGKQGSSPSIVIQQSIVSGEQTAANIPVGQSLSQTTFCQPGKQTAANIPVGQSLSQTTFCQPGKQTAANMLPVRFPIIQQGALSAGNMIVQIKGSLCTADGRLSYPIGSRIQAAGWIYVYPNAVNPGQFDARRYYLGRNVQVGMAADDVLVVQQGKAAVANRVLYWKGRFIQVLDAICDPKDAGLFQAILLGLSRQVEEPQKQLFQAAGIAHLLSISGLHVSCLAMAVYRAVRRGSGSFWMGLAGGVVFLNVYGLLIGPSASAMRAMLMFGLQMLCACYGRKYDLLSGAGLAAMVILCRFPLQILQTGFWMTFLAVLGIGCVNPVLTDFLQWRSRGGRAVLFSLSVYLATLPVVLSGSFVQSVYTAVLNLVVLPLAAYLLYAGMAGMCIGLWHPAAGMFCIGLGHFIVTIYEACCMWALRLPGARNVMGQPALWQCLLYYGILIVSLYLMQHISGKTGRESSICFAKSFSGRNWSSREGSVRSAAESRRDKRQMMLRCGSLLLLVCALCGMLGSYRDGALHVTMLDVGQGECICLQLPNGDAVLIDGGSSDVADVGNYRIVPFLLSKGIADIDLLVLTHPDADHTNGIPALLQDPRIRIRELYLPHVAQEESWQEVLALAEWQQIPVRYGAAGDRVTFGQVSFACLHPKKGKTALEANDNSIVLQMTYRGQKALFTGDLSAQAEDFLDGLSGISLLKVAHHGSKYATTAAFLERCAPKLAIVSCGAGNPYGHPHNEVLQRLEGVDCPYYVTAGKGALLLSTRGGAWDIRQYGQESGH